MSQGEEGSELSKAKGPDRESVQPTGITRHPEGAGLSEGDTFRVKGEAGKRFRFRAYVWNEYQDRGYVEAVEVKDGRRGPIRTFLVKGEPARTSGGITTTKRELIRQ